MRHPIPCCALALAAALAATSAVAASFQNLDFEAGIPEGSVFSYSDWALAVPGWRHSDGDDSDGVYAGSPHLGISQWYLLDEDPSRRLEGSYSLSFKNGNADNQDVNSAWVNAYIAQTADIAADARSVSMLALGPVGLWVGGQRVDLLAVGGNRFVGDISPFAGQTLELKLVNLAGVGDQSIVTVDDIDFSATPVPLPAAWMLLLAGLSGLRSRVRRADRCGQVEMPARRGALLAALPVVGVALLLPIGAIAATLSEGDAGLADLSNDRLQPTTFVLDYTPQANGNGFNVLTGTFGRVGGIVDLDYVRLVIPTGYALTELRVGNQTTVAGSSAFIGIAAGATMPVPPTATDAVGLLGWHHFGSIDRGADILDDMAVAGLGASGFARPLAAGDYAVWLQELAPGTYTYRLNFVIAPVPLPPAAWLLGTALLTLHTARRTS